MANSGSPASAQRIVNVNEYIYEIKEGQMKLYVWDNVTSGWVKNTGASVGTYQITTTSGIALGSGNLVSGGYVSSSLTAAAPMYYSYSQCILASGTPAAATAFIVTHIAANGYASGTVLTSAAFGTASIIAVPPVQPYLLMSGDAIVATTVSNNTSGSTWNTRIVFNQ
jgi:hypothetical protein